MKFACLTIALLLSFQGVARAQSFKARGLGALAYIETNFRMPDRQFADFYVPGQKKFAGHASAWSTGVMLSALNAAAMLDAKRIPAAHEYAVLLDAYQFKPKDEPTGYQPYPGNVPDELFYDDNEWLVMAFCDTYRLTHDASDLKRAQTAFDYVASGESNDLGGGIWWSSKRKAKNTCSNGPAACAALAMYDATKQERYLALAKKWLAWVERLQDTDGLYFDGINVTDAHPEGEVNKTKWTYNSALIIRANTELYRITHEEKYLAAATRIADAAEAKWFRADGVITDDGGFAHLLCEALLGLSDVKPRPETVKKVTRALEKLAEFSHGNGYPKRWEGWRPGEQRIELLHTASAARAFLVAAAVHP
jgi:hypothetical protein